MPMANLYIQLKSVSCPSHWIFLLTAFPFVLVFISIAWWYPFNCTSSLSATLSPALLVGLCPAVVAQAELRRFYDNFIKLHTAQWVNFARHNISFNAIVAVLRLHDELLSVWYGLFIAGLYIGSWEFIVSFGFMPMKEDRSDGSIMFLFRYHHHIQCYHWSSSLQRSSYC